MGPAGPGALRDRVRFDRRMVVDDGYGNRRGDFTPFIDERPASLEPRKGGDQVVALRLQGVAPWDLWVHYDDMTAQIVAGDRAVNLNDPRQTFRIAFAEDPDRTSRWVLMQLVAGEADG